LGRLYQVFLNNMKYSSTYSIYLIKPFNFYFLRKKFFKLQRTKWKPLQKSAQFVVRCRQRVKKMVYFLKYQNKKNKRYYIKPYKKLRKQKKNLFKQQSILIKNFFATINICPGPKGRLMYHRYYYKNLINHKKRVTRYFNTNFSLYFFKKLLLNNMNYEMSMKLAFVALEYRLEILLVRLKFFLSKANVKVNILNNNILVNFKPFYPKGLLQSGDIITFKNHIHFLKTYKKYLRHYFHCPFIEIDYYSNSIIVIYNLNELNTLYLHSIIREKLNIFLFKNYFNI